MSKRWKLATQAEIESKDGLVQIKDREGLWYLQQDMLSKFLCRPTTLELICPIQFGKMLTTSGLKLKKNDENNLDDDEAERNYLDTDEVDDITDEISKSKHDEKHTKNLRFIQTETDDSIETPKIIQISNPFGFYFDNKHYSLSDKTRDEKRAIFKSL